MKHQRYEGSFLAILLRPLGTIYVFLFPPAMLYSVITEEIIGSGKTALEIIWTIAFVLLLTLIVVVVPGFGLLKLSSYLDKRAVNRIHKKKEKNQSSDHDD